MNRMKIAQYIALGATILSVAGFVMGGTSGSSAGNFIMGIGFAAGLVSYLFGGFLTAVKMAGNIAKWGWFFFPIPYNFMTVVLSFFVAVLVFVYLPIIPVRKAYKAGL